MGKKSVAVDHAHLVGGLDRSLKPSEVRRAALKAAQTCIDRSPQIRSSALYPGVLREPDQLHGLPMLETTHDTLNRQGISVGELAVLLCESPATEFIEAVGEDGLACAVDLAVTLQSWADADGNWSRILAVEEPLTLEAAGASYVHRLARAAQVDLSDKHVRALVRLFGLGGEPASTLEVAGKEAGFTRERVRQVKKLVKVDADVRRWWPVPKVLRRALEAVEAGVPLNADEMAAMLIELGVATRPYAAASLMSLAAAYGAETGILVVGDDLLPDLPEHRLSASTFREFRDAAWGLSQKSGWVHAAGLDELAEELFGQEVGWVASRTPGMMVLPGGWLHVEPHKDPITVGTTARQLGVTPTLSVGALRVGLERRMAFRGMPPPPPESVLEAFYEQHPKFSVDDSGMVSFVGVPPSGGPTLQRTLVDYMMDGPGQVRAFDEIMTESRRLDLNPTSVKLYLSYGEQIRRIANGVYAPVGVSVSQDQVDDVRRGARRRAVKAEIDGRIAEGGRVIVTVILNDAVVNNGMFTIPAHIASALGPGEFELLDVSGKARGNLRFNASRTLFSFSSLFISEGAEPGDVLRVELNPSVMQAIGQIGSDELLV